MKLSKNYKYFFIFSASLMLVSAVFIAVWGLQLGIDFRGGTLIEMKFSEDVSLDRLNAALNEANIGEFFAQSTGDGRYIVKTSTLHPAGLLDLKSKLTNSLGEFTEDRAESVGPAIGRELLIRAYWQVLIVSLAIILYIAYAFRKIGKSAKSAALSSWKLGTATIFALIHDLVITLGLFAFLGRFFNVEVDSLFVTALLTILGFSVHDTIVVFDRIRENLEKHPHKNFAAIVDYSVSQTLSRSINTSSTLIFVLVALMLFAGGGIFYFVTAILVGIVSGTYSSIFIASPMLIFWSQKKR